MLYWVHSVKACIIVVKYLVIITTLKFFSSTLVHSNAVTKSDRMGHLQLHYLKHIFGQSYCDSKKKTMIIIFKFTLRAMRTSSVNPLAGLCFHLNIVSMYPALIIGYNIVLKIQILLSFFKIVVTHYSMCVACCSSVSILGKNVISWCVKCGIPAFLFISFCFRFS